MTDYGSSYRASTPEIQAMLEDAAQKWAAIHGITSLDPAQCQGWQTREKLTDLVEARGIDKSGLTAFMLLRGWAEDHMQKRVFSAYDLLLNPLPIAKEMRDLTALRDVLENESVLQHLEEFARRIIDLGNQFNFHDSDLLRKTTRKKSLLAALRQDALTSMTKMRQHQFMQGRTEGDLLLNPWVYCFWNINSLLRAMRTQTMNGISLVLIREPSVFRCFFAIAVKQGDSITIMTDKTYDPHPAYKDMARRPDRDLEKRMNQYWFPYQWLEIAWDEDNRRYIDTSKDSTALVPLHVEGVRIGTLATMDPAQFIWFLLMADLIRDEYGTYGKRLPEMSYTAEMVVDPEALVGQTAAVVVSGAYQPLDLGPITPAQVTTEATAPRWKILPTHFNQWMVDRYASQVPESILDVVGDRNLTMLPAHGEDVTATRWGARATITYRAMDPTEFGSAEEIQHDRIWHGRYNQIQFIKKLAQEEYLATKDALYYWYKARILAQEDLFFDIAAMHECILPCAKARWKPNENPFKIEGFTGLAVEERNCLGRTYDDWYYDIYSYSGINTDYRSDVLFGKKLGRYDRHHRCADMPEFMANVYTQITPDCPHALAILCGVPMAELPWQMQHWYKDEPYYGNSILNRVDPAEWAMENPWRQCTFKIGIPLSKAAIQKRRKVLGLPRDDWEFGKRPPKGS